MTGHILNQIKIAKMKRGDLLSNCR